jgi:GST-like protein
MIDLYTASTPNGQKPLIMLEELGLPYTIHLVNLTEKEQFKPEYIALNPNSKIPTLVDSETGITIFESGAILIYLAEKTGQFLPTDLGDRTCVVQWLMFQMANVGPMFGQLGHFLNSAPEPLPYAIRRYELEAQRLCQVLDKQLNQQDYLVDHYSIADIATYPWVATYDYLELNLEDYPHLSQWMERIQHRPAVQRALTALS